MRVFNLIKSAYKDTARLAKIINLPNMIIVLRVEDDLLIASYHHRHRLLEDAMQRLTAAIPRMRIGSVALSAPES